MFLQISPFNTIMDFWRTTIDLVTTGGHKIGYLFSMSIQTLRQLILEIASTDPRIGPVEETLKWGQPSIAPVHRNIGTPIQLGETKDGDIGLFVHCQTTVISEFRSMHGDAFKFDGNRAILFPTGSELPLDALAPLIKRALTYHLNKD